MIAQPFCPSAPVAVATEADQLAGGQALRDRLDRLHAFAFHGAQEVVDCVGALMPD
jgi:hypothetical protein